MIVAGFDWDEGNWPKCGKHGVSQQEIEALCRSSPAVYPDLAHSSAEARLLAVGRSTEGRWLFVAFTLRQRGRARLIRPISARYMRKKEVEHFERQSKASKAEEAPDPEDGH